MTAIMFLTITQEAVMLTYASPPPRNCDQCPNVATMVWGAAWSRDQYACNDHPPDCLTSMAFPLPGGFWLKTLSTGMALGVPHTTGHLGIAH